MRAILVVLCTAAAVAVLSSSPAESENPVPSTVVAAPTTPSPTVKQEPRCKATQATFHRYVRKVYRRDKIRTRALRRLDRMRFCAFTKKAAHNMLAYQHRQGVSRKQRKLAASVTPFAGPNGTRWAIPWYVVSCESGGANLPPNSAGASGYYQFIPGTWRSMGGSTAHAYQAGKIEQDLRAGRLWAGGSGAGQWDCA